MSAVRPRCPRAAAAIRAGGIVAFPTDTLYALGADPFNRDAVRRLFQIKGRASDQAIPLVASDMAQTARQLGSLSRAGRRLADRFWPGPLTLVMAAPESTPLADEVTAGTGRVGVRVPAHDVARDLCQTLGGVLTATSANRSGEPPSDDPDVVAQSFDGIIDVLLDAGWTTGGLPSTIVDVSREELRLIRVGAISWEEVEACARLA